MKFLFIVQGEGRGHLTQAITLEKLLIKNGHQVVKILVGRNRTRKIPDFFKRNIKAPIEQFSSPNFLPTSSNKRADIPRSIIYNIYRLPQYIRSIRFIREQITESEADIVINFYELLTGLTYLIYAPQTPDICIGHQYLFLHKDFKFPNKNIISLFFLNFFTRLTSIGACKRLALSFHNMNDDISNKIHVIPPLIREEVYQQKPTEGNYIHGYMVNCGFSDNVIEWHNKNKSVPLHFFWDKKDEPQIKEVDDTLKFFQLDDKEFLKQMKGCMAYASTAGFESICEAMYLSKPIIMVPAHIEQDCNAFDAMMNGAGIIDNDFNLTRLLEFAKTYRPNKEFIKWVHSSEHKIIHELESVDTTGRYHQYAIKWL